MMKFLRIILTVLALTVALGAGVNPSSPTSAASVISPDGWEWWDSLPQEWSLYDVWGSSSTDVYAVGSDCTIMHFDGGTWRCILRDTSSRLRHLRGVWGSSSSDVFAVGRYFQGSGSATTWRGGILHCDGSSWSSMNIGMLNSCRHSAG